MSLWLGDVICLCNQAHAQIAEDVSVIRQSSTSHRTVIACAALLLSASRPGDAQTASLSAGSRLLGHKTACRCSCALMLL